MYSIKYIPHKTPKKPNYDVWKKEYIEHLVIIYNIFKNFIEEKYDVDIDWNNSFELFIEFIYNNSSKYIYPA